MEINLVADADEKDNDQDLDEKAQQSVSQDFLEKLKGNGCVVLGENETVPDSGEFLEHTAGAITVFAKQ